MTIVLIYIGNGAFLAGVPARDLNAEEVREYGGKEALIASGLYKEAGGFEEASENLAPKKKESKP